MFLMLVIGLKLLAVPSTSVELIAIRTTPSTQVLAHQTSERLRERNVAP